MKGTKRFAAALTAVFTASALVMSASAAAHNYRGDINRDDKVDGTDVVYLQKYIANKSYISDKNLVYADVNGDGNINVIDLILLKRLANNKATPEEVAVTTPAVTTAVTTTSTTSSTAAPTKVSTAETTKATTTITTTAKATTAATTKATTKATTTTTTTKATTKATTTTTTTTKATTKATTTTTTTKATTKATTTTTTTTTKATTASTTKATTLATVNNGRNSLAAESADRGWIVLGGDASQCDYVSNASDFLPGSVRMPAITGDGTYIAEFYITDEALAEHDGGITYASLDILKGGTWSAYSMEEKPNLKVTVTGAIIDGRNVDVSGLTQNSGSASVHIESILGMCNSVNLEFKVEGFNDTAVSTSVSSETTTITTTTTTSAQSGGQNNIAGTDVARAVVAFGNDPINNDFIKNGSQFVSGSVQMPEINGDGQYTCKFTLKEPSNIYYTFLKILKPNSYNCYDGSYNISIDITNAVVNGETVSVSSLRQESSGYAATEITNILGNGIESLELTFNVSGMPEKVEYDLGESSIAGTNVQRAGFFTVMDNWSTQFTNEDSYANLDKGSKIPQINGNGKYTARLVFNGDRHSVLYTDLILLDKDGGNGINKNNYPNLNVTINKVVVDGKEVQVSSALSEGNNYYYNHANYDLSNLIAEGTICDKYMEVTFTISGM